MQMNDKLEIASKIAEVLFLELTGSIFLFHLLIVTPLRADAPRTILELHLTLLHCCKLR
jgi:hypothetical protein